MAHGRRRARATHEGVRLRQSCALETTFDKAVDFREYFRAAAQDDFRAQQAQTKLTGKKKKKRRMRDDLRAAGAVSEPWALAGVLAVQRVHLRRHGHLPPHPNRHHPVNRHETVTTLP
eukprot:3492903-Rhodomonas_salina.1